jgi:hypothetical protein
MHALTPIKLRRRGRASATTSHAGQWRACFSSCLWWFEMLLCSCRTVAASSGASDAAKAKEQQSEDGLHHSDSDVPLELLVEPAPKPQPRTRGAKVVRFSTFAEAAQARLKGALHRPSCSARGARLCCYCLPSRGRDGPALPERRG